jgi:formylglycine-generating enzyme required for sulfatase activity
VTLAVLLAAAVAAKAPPARARIPAGTYRPFFADTAVRSDAGVALPDAVEVPAFDLDARPVTRGEFLEFVRANPRWRRSRVPRLFADPGYLRGWPEELDPGSPGAPVTEVSWFAAKAYCHARGATLPTVAQWERAAEDPAASAQVLAWYAKPSTVALRDAGSGPPNRYGVRDLHGLIWEWVLDFNANLVADDGRDPGSSGGARFCGSGAATAVDPSDYATFMRHAFRDSLKASYTVKDLGFRCARAP